VPGTVIKSSYQCQRNGVWCAIMTDQQVWIRLRDARPIPEWFTKAVIEESALTIQVLPEALLANRRALTYYLTEQLRNLSRRKATELEQSWEAYWEKHMSAHFTDLPENLQN
jgi:hypothetical protein